MSAFATRFMWQSSSTNATPIIDTTLTVLKAAPTALDAGSTIALTDIDIVNTHATVTTLVNLLVGATVVATFNLPALGANPVFKSFTTPIIAPKGSAISIQAVTTGANIYWNARGFTLNN